MKKAHGVLLAELDAPARGGVRVAFVEGDAAVGEEHRARHLHEVLPAGVRSRPSTARGRCRRGVGSSWSPVMIVHRAAGRRAVVEQPGLAARDVDARLGGRSARRARRATVGRGPSWRGLVAVGVQAPSWPIRGAARPRGCRRGCGGGRRAQRGHGRRARPPERAGRRQVGGERGAGAGQRACRAARPARAPPRRRPRAPSSRPRRAPRPAHGRASRVVRGIEREIPPSGPFPRY